MQYNADVMENHNPDTQNFVPAVVAHHRAMATARYGDALAHARVARDSAPCDSEAARWAVIVMQLEAKTARGLAKIGLALGIQLKGGQQ